MDCCAVVVAAGSGKRMGADRAKQYLLLDGIPILAYTLIRLSRIPQIDGIVLVVPQDDCSLCKTDMIDAFGVRKIIDIVPGGRRRQDSVFNGLRALQKVQPSYVLIHDGVRPFFSDELCLDIIEETRRHGAVIPGLPVVCTIKECNGNHEVLRTIPRDALWEIQTPQGFCYKSLYAAYETVVEKDIDVTDDSMVMEFIGGKVKIIEGNKENIKITRPVDLPVAHQIMTGGVFAL
ncbi:MAG: 2-C-methyl-D-erythritol 4-phosphate cytidylyltransferase [Candidatus Auribacterota bacterium]|jgi:2-C-methyl-D-erythritol 4-phosphate cytidylyltransferase|nr:2-C-methyl-D-erythritol 4-phosphate cytidylyltransferase [Candidatus Auribacterota bacterium]